MIINSGHIERNAKTNAGATDSKDSPSCVSDTNSDSKVVNVIAFFNAHRITYCK